MNQPPYVPPPQQWGYPPQQPPPKRGMSGWMIVLIVVASLAVVGFGSCVVCVGVVGKAASDAQRAAASVQIPSPGARSVPIGPPIAVSAKQLFADYHANEVAADEKYKGRNLLVSGTIASIDKDAFGNIQLRLGAGDQFGLQTVDATLDDSQKSRAMTLSKGQPQAVLCTGDGMIIGSPMLDGCQLQ